MRGHRLKVAPLSKGDLTGTATFVLATNGEGSYLQSNKDLTSFTTTYSVNGTTLPSNFVAATGEGTLSDTDSLGNYYVLGSQGGSPKYWTAGNVKDLPEAAIAINDMTVTLPPQGLIPGKLVAAPQILTASGYLREMQTGTAANAGTFGQQEDLNKLIVKNTGYSGMIPTAINNNGAIVGTAVYTGTMTTAGSHGVMLLPAELAVDANRDGTIAMANSNPTGAPVDTTSQTSPYRFWVNNDQDNLSNSSPGETEPPTHSDYLNMKINTVRNLEDFSRLWINLKGLNTAISGGQITVGLEWHSNTGGASDGWGTGDGAPAINIYKAVESDGRTKYLFGDESPSTGLSSATDLNNATALAQTTGAYNNALGQVAKGTPFYFPATFWSALTDANPKSYLLFEGAAEGKGRLVITFNTGTAGHYTKIGEGGAVYMSLLDIKKMYVRGQVNLNGVAADNMPSPYSNVSTFADPAPQLSSGAFDSIQYDKPPDQTDQVIVFVHGINQPVPSYVASSETVFKRLFWSGYKGKFAAFRWPCLTPGGLTVPFAFNESEYRGWKSGGALKQFLKVLFTLGSKKPDAHFDWSASIQGQGGTGLLESLDSQQFVAPEGGYVSQTDLSMATSDPSWKVLIQKQYYVHLGNGNYARIQAEISPSYDNNPSVNLTVTLNPSGSRNLEFDSSKQIDQ
jgi:hypothetical protein